MVQLVTPASLCFVFAGMQSIPVAAAAMLLDTNPHQQATEDAPMAQQESQHQLQELPDTETTPPWTPSQQYETSVAQQSSLSSSGAGKITTSSLPALASPKAWHQPNSTVGVNTTSSAPSSPTGNHEEAGHDAPEKDQKTRTPQAAAIVHLRKHDTSRSCLGDHDSSTGDSSEDMKIDTLNRQQGEHLLPTSESPAALELPPIRSDHDLSLQNVNASSSTRPSSSILGAATAIAAMLIVLLHTGSL